MNETGARRTVLLTAVLCVFAAQQVVMPVLAPLAREIGLSEFRLGLVISLSAAMLAVSSPLWGRLCDRRGPKPLLVGGLGLATAGLAGFAAVSRLALDGALDPTTAYVLMLATRSLVFGVGLAAVPVAAMAVIAAGTDAAGRSAGLSRLGAMQALSLVVGPALGGVVAFAGLIGPLLLAPAALAVVTVLVALLVPASAPASRPERDPAARVRLLDPRIWPYLLAGFGLFLALGLTLLTVGFLLQDRLALDAAATARTSGGVLFACGLVLVGVQGVLVPRLGWPPARLLRAGTPVAVVGACGLALAPGLITITVSMVVLAAGLGTAQVGYLSGPTLHVADSEQGAVAGLVQATNGATFVVGPAAGTALYALAPVAPFVAAAIAAALALLVVLVHPTLRREPAVPATV